jgi:alkylated DNA nucleotide flippase Atl1
MYVAEVKLRDILDGSKQYRVPLYQRPYSWTKKQLQRLWSDIVELAETRADQPSATHFTGSLVLSVGDVGPSGNTFLVVDGQQRLTALTILIAAIRDYYEDTEPDAVQRRAQLHETYLADRFKSGDSRLKLLPTQADRGAYRGVIDRNLPDSENSGVVDAYRFFRHQLKLIDDPDNPDDIELITSAILDGLVFVSITAQHDDNVFRIFESLNNTGMKLTQGDLLRNYIFMRLGDIGETVYESWWLPMQNRLSSDDLEALFWMDITWTAPEVKQGDIYAAQQERLARLSADDVLNEVKRFSRLSGLLEIIRKPSLEQDPAVRYRIERQVEWGFSSANPLILRLLDLREQEAATSQQVSDALGILESYLVRRLIIGASPNALSRILLRAAQDLGAGPVHTELLRYFSVGRKFFATDAQVTEAVVSKPFFYLGRTAQQKTLLGWVEQTYGTKEPVDLERTTREHVMPQTLSPAWRASLSDDLVEGDSVDDVHEQLVHTLANLTLTGYNSELSNLPFPQKRELLGNSGIRMNAAIAQEQKWGRTQILERGVELAERIINTWASPLDVAEDVESGAQWRLATEAVTAIPAGRWCSYGDLAVIAGTHPVPLGQFLVQNPVAGAWRVLHAAGTLSPGFRWGAGSPYAGSEPQSVLEREGLSFVNGKASTSQRIAAGELAALIGVTLETDADPEDEEDVGGVEN